jgi:hypothetical protein
MSEDIPREFVFTRYPAKQGTVWLRTAYTMFSQHRGAWVMLVLGYFIALMLVRIVPYVGPFAMTIMKPVFAVGLLAAAWHQERGGVPQISDLFRGFRTNLRALLVIGVFFVAGITIAVYASSIVDDGRLLEFIAMGGTFSEEQLAERLADPRLTLGMIFSALLSLPVLVATWWAPALVVFQDASALAALGASLRAALANWKALAMYGLAVFFYGGVVPALVYALIALVATGQALSLMVVALLLPYSLFFASTLHVSDYVSYRDVFHANETLAPLSRTP